jgi:drug/metabolite transporter (DMT)-like permease
MAGNRQQLSRRSALGLMFAAALLWSAGGVAIKTAAMLPVAVAGWRSLFALPILGFVAIARARSQPESARTAICSPWVWTASSSYALMVIAFVVATKLTTAANAIFIQYSSIVHIAVLSWPLLRERIGWREGVACGGVLVGMSLFFGEHLAISSVRASTGDALAFVSSLAAAWVVIAIRRGLRPSIAIRDASAVFPSLVFAVGNAMTVLVCSPWMLASRSHPMDTWVLLAAMGAVQTGVSYILYGIAITRLTALESSLASTFDPILNPVWVLLATGERPSRLALVGGAFVLASVVLLATARTQRVAREDK